MKKSRMDLLKGGTVVVANGEFPRKGGLEYKVLSNADRVIACDGAAVEYKRRFRRDCDFAIGDFDSMEENVQKELGNRAVYRPCQDMNDLEKAICFCIRRGWGKPIVVGAMGKRADHLIGNVYRAMVLGTTVVTDYGYFIPFRHKIIFEAGKGEAVSVFSIGEDNHMTSSGLAWPLEKVTKWLPFTGTLNRAEGGCVTLTAASPAFIFRADGLV